MARNIIDEPIIWKNGEAQREYEYTKTLLRYSDLPPHVTVILQNRMKNAVDDNEHDYSVFAGFGLGFFFMSGLALIMFTSWTAMGIYLASLCLYHMLEFTYVWKFHPKDCGFNSFLFFPNEHYHLAMGFSFFEYVIESYLFPSIKDSKFFITIGLIGVIIGQAFRTGAMWTAGSNFHHLVRERRETGHDLVTTGIYGIMRHPSYFGWFYWALANQVILMNPICICAFPYALWMFFSDRIQGEEETLISFFGQKYVDYKKRVPACYIPGIAQH